MTLIKAETLFVEIFDYFGEGSTIHVLHRNPSSFTKLVRFEAVDQVRMLETTHDTDLVDDELPLLGIVRLDALNGNQVPFLI